MLDGKNIQKMSMLLHDGISLNDMVGGGDPKVVGQETFDILLRYGAIKPESRVFELGCGCGRAAVSILNYLGDKGAYVGCDILSPLISFCKDYIQPHFNNAYFYLLNEGNPLYNRYNTKAEQRVELSDICLSMDSIIAFSVFTHFDELMAIW